MPAPSTRYTLSLAGEWTRRLEGPEGKPLGDPASVFLPGMWDEDPAGLGQAAGFVHYERTFTRPDWPQAQRWALRLEGVSAHAQVRLNGKVCIHHMGDRQAVEVAINDLLQPGLNHLSIRLDNLLGPSILPLGTSHPDPGSPLGYRNVVWGPGPFVGGIPGDILLLATPWSYWERADLTWQPQGQGGRLRVRSRPLGPYATITASLETKDGQVLARASAGPGQDLDLDISQVPFWRPDKPMGHLLILASHSPARLLDSWTQAFAIPDPSLDYSQAHILPGPEGLYGPGGQDLLLAGLGPDQVLDASLYPLMSPVLDRADRAGIPLVAGVPFGLDVPEAFLPDVQAGLPVCLAAWEQAAFAFIRRAALHPCLAAWNFATPWQEAKESQNRIVQVLALSDPFQRPVML